MSEGTLCMIAVGLFPGMILVALGLKVLEARRVRRWPATTGKVIASRVRSRRNKPGDPGYDFHDTEVTNEPFVEYEYAVGGKTYTCTRIDIGERTSGFELEAILARYPVGAAVTVFYDPADPSKAMLERDLPAVAFVGIGCLLAFLVGGPLTVALVYDNGVGWLEPYLADPDAAPFVAVTGVFGLAVALFALAAGRVVWQASRWPTTRGRVVASGTETTIDRTDGGRRTMHRAAVVYTYEVNGRQFLGDRLTFGVNVSATFPGLGRRTAAKYPVGREVTVYYDPANPGVAVLHPWSYLHLVPFLAAAVMLALAWAVAAGRM